MLTSRVRAVRGFTRAMSFVVAVLIAVFGLTMIGGSAYADKDKAEKYDFYTLSSNVTAYFSDATKPGEGDGLSADEGWTTIAQNASEGGNLLGYGDDDVSSFSGWLVSKATGSSNTVGYDSLKVRDNDSSSANSAYSGVLAYAQYGSLLNALGLDSTSTGLGLHFQNMAFGSIMALLYLLAGGIDTIFSAVIWLLETLNPFKLFFSAISASSTAMANGMTGGQGVPVWMQSLDTWFSGWYQALVNLSWTVLVPLFIFTFIISSLMWKKGNALNGLKKLVIRMLFLGVGLPLIGSMYTASLGVMKDATAGAGMGATRVVISTFVDFENWAKKDRLAVPDNATLQWDASKQAPTGASVNKLRQTTVAINKLANSGAFSSVSDIDVSGLGSISMEAAKADTTSSGGLKDFTYVAAMEMLLRYTTAQSYQASDFDTAIKGRISQQASSGQEQVKSCATTWFNVQADGSTKADGKSGCSATKASDNPVLKVREGSGLQASGESGTITFTTSGDKYAGDWVMLGENFNGSNLSALSMYNYLNTTFDKNSATTYSSSNAVSSATREYHNSVNLVGSAGVSWLYWVNGAVTLLCFIVLGLGYAFGMFTGAIKNSMHIITAVPFATLGSMAGIAKVLIYTFTMITEIIATMFIYRLVQEIILSIPSIFEGGLEHMFNSMGGFGVYLKNSGNVTLFTSLVSTVLLILLTWKMMHFRGAFVKGLNEAVTKIVDKFLDTNVAPPAGGGKLMPALAGGVGAGVGSAAANRLMSGRGGLGSGSGRGGASSGLMAGSGGIQDGNGGVSGMGGGMLSINGTDGPGPDEIGPGASGGDPSAPGGGGGGLLLSDGSGGVNTDNNTSSDNSGALMTSESDRQLASEVDARGGLSEPAQIEAGPQADAAASSKVANNADDAMSETAGSIQSTMDAHNKADKARVDQATSGVKAVWHGGKAAAKAYSGDVAGAAQDGQKALGDVQSAQTKGQEAKAHRQSAEAPRPVQPARTSQPQSQPQRGAVGAQRQAPAQAQPQQPQQQVPTQTQASAQTPAPSRPAPSRGGSSRSLSAPRQGSSQMPAKGSSQSASSKAGKGLKGMKPSGGSSMPPMPS
nr:MAG TPA: Huntingtin protein-like protein [Caudoviricetes sp.]